MPHASIYKIIALFCTITFISGCPSSPSSNGDTTLEVTVTLPSSITSITNVRAYIQQAGESRLEMTYTAGSASHTYTGLNSGISQTLITYDVFIEYDLTTPITLAMASSTITIASGTNVLEFTALDFDVTLFDEDGDSKNNVLELISGSNPLIPTCVLGSAVLGSCELDS